MQNILIFENEVIASDFLALVFAATISERSAKHMAVNLGFATGVTPLLMYQKLIEIYKGKYQIKKTDFTKFKVIAKRCLNLDLNFLGLTNLKTEQDVFLKPISWKQVQTFNLDEFVGLDCQHPERFFNYMQQHLFQELDLDSSAINFPNPDCQDLLVSCQAYETKISKVNDSLLQLITLGINGHMAYNEPGTALDSLTHVAKLSDETRANLVKQKKFPDLLTTPTTAMTVGIKTILKMKQVIMVAFGANKAEMTKRMLENPINQTVTASALQNHPNCLYVLDRAAAQLLKTENQKYQITYV